MGKIALIFILLVTYIIGTENMLNYGVLQSYKYNHFNSSAKIMHASKIFVNQQKSNYALWFSFCLKLCYLSFLCDRIKYFSLNDKLSLPTGQLHQVPWKIFSQ